MTLDEIRAISDPVGRVAALRCFLAELDDLAGNARRLRDETIAGMLEMQGAAAVARKVKMSLAHVNNVKAWSRR